MVAVTKLGAFEKRLRSLGKSKLDAETNKLGGWEWGNSPSFSRFVYELSEASGWKQDAGLDGLIQQSSLCLYRKNLSNFRGGVQRDGEFGERVLSGLSRLHPLVRFPPCASQVQNWVAESWVGDGSLLLKAGQVSSP